MEHTGNLVKHGAWSTGGGCDIEQRVMQTINTPKIMRGVETGELRLIGEN